MRFAIVLILFNSVILTAGSPEWDRANELYQHTEYQQSLTALLRLNPKDVGTLQLIGQDYFMLGDYKKASDAFEKAVSLAPKDAVCAHWLGRTYGRRAEAGNPFTAPGYATKTRQMFEKAVELDPRNGEAVNDLFDFYLQAPGFLGGGIQKAEALARHIAELDEAEGHYAQAQLDEKRKQFDSAEQHLRRAAQIAPHQVGRILDVAKYLAKRGRIKESDAWFDRATAMAPSSARVLFERADTYIREQRNRPEARELLERYVHASLTPDDPPREQAVELLKKMGA
jgi:tetratricopeptide (TPR) repeat protein